MSPWQTLGVATDIAVPELRRRYAALIKEFRPETHPQDFARIREAYEVVLTHARRREALAAEKADVEEPEAASAQAGDVAQIAQVVADPLPLAVDDEAAPVEVIAAPLVAETPPEQDAEPALAAHFRRFHAQAATAKGSDEEAHLPALRALLQARTQATLDDSQALEFALMRWFIEAEAPPLTLLFETGRAFDWHRHPARLSSWLSPWAQRQMEARLALSRDLVYARHFSGNAWLRRLHSPRAGFVAVVFRPAAVEAQHWAERWCTLSEEADTPLLEEGLEARALRRLRGFASTDVLTGLGVAAITSDLETAAIAGVVTTGLVFLARLALQAIVRLPQEHRARRFARTIMDNKTVCGVVSAVAGAIGVALIGSSAPKGAEIAAGLVLILPATLLAAALLWRVAAFAELVFASPFQWREAVDRLEFDRFLYQRATYDASQPFGSRLGWLQRLKSIRPALHLQANEIATRARTPRAKPFKLIRLTTPSGETSLWRALWFIGWIVFALLRVLNGFGTH